MANATPIADGTYYISSQISSTFVTLTDAAEGTNLTAWGFDGSPHQQWRLSSNGAQYVFQNVQFGSYITPGVAAPLVNGTVILGSLSPSPWAILQYKGGFIVVSPSFPDYTFNLAGSGYGNATPILMYPFTLHFGPDNTVWYFNSTTPAPTTTSTSTSSASTCTATCLTTFTTTVTARAVHSPSVGAITGGVIGGIAVLLLLVYLVLRLRRSELAAQAAEHAAMCERQNAPSAPSNPAPFVQVVKTGSDAAPSNVITPQSIHQQSHEPPAAPQYTITTADSAFYASQ